MPEPWDPADTGSMSDQEWRRTVVRKFNTVDAEVRENTEVTKDTAAAVDTLTRRVAPMADSYEKVAKGFEVLGWIGSAFEWLARKWMWILAAALAVKIVMTGGSWADVIKLFKDIPP
mgnify:FL=1